MLKLFANIFVKMSRSLPNMKPQSSHKIPPVNFRNDDDLNQDVYHVVKNSANKVILATGWLKKILILN